MWVSVGFGVNLTVAPDLPPGAGAPPTCLRGLGWRGDAAEGVRAIAQAFLDGVQEALADPEATRRRWVERTVHRPGDTLRVRVGDRVLEGTFAGFDRDALLLLDVGGTVQKFAVGEVLAPDRGGGS